MSGVRVAESPPEVTGSIEIDAKFDRKTSRKPPSFMRGDKAAAALAALERLQGFSPTKQYIENQKNV